MTREERLELLKQIEKDIFVCSIESTFLDDAKSCAIHSAIEELEQEPCEDCVSRQALLDMATTIETDDFSGNEIIEVVEVDDIKNLPSVTPIRKKGKWIPLPFTCDYKSNAKCSLCHDSFIDAVDYSYCPNCGAKMEVEV